MLLFPLPGPLFYERESGMDSDTVLASHLADLRSDHRSAKKGAVESARGEMAIPGQMSKRSP
jgi:hypothetical protein